MAELADWLATWLVGLGGHFVLLHLNQLIRSITINKSKLHFTRSEREPASERASE